MFIEVCSSDYCHKIDKIVKELNFKSFSIPVNSRSNTFSTLEKVDFCMDVIYPLSSKLIDGSLYYDQSLVVIVYDASISFKNITESKLEPTTMKCVLFFERSNEFQAYRLAKLSNCPHFTLLTSDLPTFVSNLNDLLHTPVDMVFVAKTVPFYKNKVLSAMVINSSSDLIDSKSITDASSAMFKLGLGDKFSLQDQGRGDVIGNLPAKTVRKKDRTIPTFTVGYSNMECNKYKSNRLTILGHIKPFIRDGGLSLSCKSAYLEFTRQIMQTPICKGAFDMSGLSDIDQKIRQSMIKDFYVAMGGDPSKNYKSWFLTESNADLTATMLAPHCDKQNSSIPGLDDVVVFTTHPSVHVLESQMPSCPRDKVDTELTSKSKTHFSLHEYVKSRGYLDTFPHTRVHYMKGIVGNHVRKLRELELLSAQDTFSQIIVWGLTKTMNTPLDYHGHVFDRSGFPEFWGKHAKDYAVPGSYLKSEGLEVTPALDKMGYYSLNIEVWNFFITGFLKSTTVLDAINYAFFCCWTCNGTVLPWRICYETFSDIKKSYTQYKQCENFFTFLQVMDELVAQIQADEDGLDCPRRPGSCRPSRSQYSKVAMTTDWSHKTKSVLAILNVAFYNGCPKDLDKAWTKKAKTMKGHHLFSEYIQSLQGIGPFLAHTFISFLSLLGVCPLRTYENALMSQKWTSGSGTVKLAAACIPPDERKGRTPLDCYMEVRKKINSIMGNEALTIGYLENDGCETWRTYCGKLAVLNLSWKTLEVHMVEIVMDKLNHGKSDKVDFYMFMPQKKGIQNVYLYGTSTKGLTTSSPGLLMRSPSDWEKGPIVYSDWSGPTTKTRGLPNLVYWNKDDMKQPFLSSTTLMVTEELKKLYRPQREQRNRKTPNRFQNETYKGGKRMEGLNRSVFSIEDDSDSD